MKNSFWFVLCACGLLACDAAKSPAQNGQTGSASPDRDASSGGKPQPSGQSDGCQDDSQCKDSAEAELEGLAHPGTRTITISGAKCADQWVQTTDGGLVGGPSCECSITEDRETHFSIGPTGIDCFMYGRGGDCLWKGSEFDGCDVDDTHSCDDICAELAKRFADDQARTFRNTKVIASTCDGACADFVEINGHCYVNQSYEQGKTYDCALGSEGFLKQWAEDE